MAVTDLSQLDWVRRKQENTTVVHAAVPLSDSEQIQSLFTLKLLDENRVKFVSYGDKASGGVVVDLTTNGLFRRYHDTDYLLVSSLNGIQIVPQTEYEAFFISDLLDRRYDSRVPRVNYTEDLPAEELKEIQNQAKKTSEGGGSAAPGPKSPPAGPKG